MPDLTPDVERELAALDDALAGRRVATDLTELGELALALREERERPTDSFGNFLDSRVQRGFPGRDPRARVSGRRWWSALLSAPALGTATAVLIVAVIVVAGPKGDSGSSAGGGGGATSLEAGGGAVADTAVPENAGREAAVAQDESAATSSAEPDGSSGFVEPLPPVPPDSGGGSPGSDNRVKRAEERSASLTLAARPRDIDDVSRRIQAETRRLGGFVVSSTVSSSEGGGGGTFNLRIPTRNLDEAMTALSQLGRVRERAQRSNDITAATVSARSRLKDARTERKSLLRQLAEAVTVNETAAIRTRLDIVSREIEQARAGVRRVRNRAAFSNVSVTLIGDSAVAPADEDDQWTPGDAAKDALRVLEVAAGVALIVLAVVVPLALLAALGALAARWSRRRRREHALDAV